MVRDARGNSSRGTRELRIGVAVLAGLLLVGGGAWAFAAWSPELSGLARSVEVAEARIRSWGAWGVGGSILLMVVHSFVPFPAEILAMANGMVYGPLWGTVVTWVGAMLGAYLAFGLARWLGRPFVLALLAERRRRALDAWVARQGGGALFFSRFVPVISFNLINYAAGLAAVSWWTFTWATGLGILPLTFVMVLAGHGVLAGHSWVWLPAAGVLGWAVWWKLAPPRRARDEQI